MSSAHRARRHFQGANSGREYSLTGVKGNSKEFIGAAMEVAQKMIKKHADEGAAEVNQSPNVAD